MLINLGKRPRNQNNNMNKSRIKSFINSILSILGFSIIKISTQQEILNNLNNIKIQNQKYNFLIKNNIKKPAQLLQEHESSKSQICQDWFVLDSLNYLNLVILLK